MAAETLPLSNGAVANGDHPSNPNLVPKQGRRCRKQKKNSNASQAPSCVANDDDSKDNNDPQQFFFFGA
nr:hypothetical protein CFP56_77223 [Quercus suber]